MTADTFDSLQISDLCRWAVVQNDTVLQTNMDDRHLKIALNAFHGGSGNPASTSTMSKWLTEAFAFCSTTMLRPTPTRPCGTRCRISRPAIFCLLAVLILVWLGWQTHCTVRVFAAETARLHRAVDAIAAQQPERIDADGARLREFSATLHAMQTMGRELTDSLQSQWRMEQQRAEQIAALTHDLKTPLSIIQGNADLLAEDALSADQQTQVEAILRGTDRAQQYLAALRTACAPSAAGETFPSHTLVSAAGGNSPRPLRTCRGAAYTERAVAGDTVRGAVRPAPGCRKPAGQRRALYAPRRHRHTVGYKRETGFHPACDRYRPRLHCRGPRQSGGAALYRSRPQ